MPILDPVAISRIGASYANDKGFISVALGAFGAHGLQKTVTDPKLIHNWETASTYLMFNGLAMLAISGHPRLGSRKFAAGAIAVGSALFSGSIYALVLWRSRGKTGGRVLGPVTPLGGLIMLAGWGALIL